MTTLALKERLVDQEEVQEIELVVRMRMKEHAAGGHSSVFHGDGFNFVGLRDWQPGDRPSAIDWAQSTITNFSPLVTRDFEKDSTASMMLLADASRSTQCGTGRHVIAKVIARAVATLGLAAAFFQDQMGLITFDGRQTQTSVRSQVGRAHAMHCLDTYQTAVTSNSRAPASHPNHVDTHHARDPRAASATRLGLFSMLRRTSFVPVISDFLFEDAPAFLDELGELGALHDVVLVMVDGGFAFDLPPVSAGWVEVRDAETGRTQLLSTRELGLLGEQAREFQRSTVHAAERRGLEVVTLQVGQEHQALADFLTARRVRKR